MVFGQAAQDQTTDPQPDFYGPLERARNELVVTGLDLQIPRLD